MATLPPRKNLTPTRASKQNLSPLQILLQMGFPKHRAEKALASTGNQGVHLASDWLLSHVNDPYLDEYQPREYILYACPNGAFLDQLEEFWNRSKEICGWNGAHNYMPHITLVSFFKAPDECSLHLSKALKQVVDAAGAVLDRPLKLELYTSQNFMGFFVAEDDANFLKRLALQYVKDVSNSIISDTYEQLDAIVACFPWCGAVSSGNRCIPRSSRSISLEPHVKSLHLTLAYQFLPNQLNLLKTLAESLEPSCASNWEFRLYSRDARLATKQVQRVLYPHSPRETDELELRLGDLIYIANDALENSNDGWVDGISWLTGIDGHLPGNYTERTAESDAWTLHRVIELCSCATPSMVLTEDNEAICGTTRESTNGLANFNSMKEILSHNGQEQKSHVYTTADMNSKGDAKSSRVHRNTTLTCDTPTISSNNYDSEAISDNNSSPMKPNNGDCQDESTEQSSHRKLYIMRHGERVDFTFGTWIPYCFDEFGNYLRKDLNMPKILPKRVNCPDAWQNDTPLTNVGLYQARLVGEGLQENGVVFDAVFCSPSFRCIQTCSSALEGLQIKDQTHVNIEPGLFEWMTWYSDGIPDWCTADELTNANFNINHDYKPIVNSDELNASTKETCADFYARNFSTISKIIENTSGNIFIVAHAATLDTCTRQLLGREPRDTNELRQIIHKVPYCSILGVEKFKSEWKFIETFCLPITHSKNSRFEWINMHTN